MSKSKILLQLDPDPHASVFDSVVAVDSGVDQLFRHDNVAVDNIEGLVHGTIFTRGPGDLKSTAIFIGGHNVAIGEELLEKVKKTFFGPMRVSVMLDSNGANTTAAAAVLCAVQNSDLKGKKVAVLAGTGPVGQRVTRLAARQGAIVHVGSRLQTRAEMVCNEIQTIDPNWNLVPFSTENSEWPNAIADCEVLFAAGAAGVELISTAQLAMLPKLEIAIDLNAVPPAGIAGVDVMSSGKEVDGVLHFGAIGVGGLKMKIHKAGVKKLFTTNDLILDADEIYDLGQEIV